MAAGPGTILGAGAETIAASASEAASGMIAVASFMSRGRCGGRGAVETISLRLSGSAEATIVDVLGVGFSACGGCAAFLRPKRLANRLPMEGPPPAEACVAREALRERISA